MGKLLRLLPHPDFPPEGVQGVEVRLWSPDDPNSLSIDYRVEGADRLILPPAAPPRRADRLWEATCFELFARAPGAEAYFELNLSPSGRWAAYAFDSHRSGMREQPVRAAPPIEAERQGRDFVLRADLDLTTLPTWRLRAGVSAILEEEGGRRSYWALAHPAGDPDFHHPDCFALDLPPAELPSSPRT